MTNHDIYYGLCRRYIRSDNDVERSRVISAFRRFFSFIDEAAKVISAEEEGEHEGRSNEEYEFWYEGWGNQIDDQLGDL